MANQDLAERIAKLEQANRRLAGGLIGLGAVVAALLALGASGPSPRSIEAQSFIVKDVGGKVRGSLGMTPGPDVALILWDADGKVIFRAPSPDADAAKVLYYGRLGDEGPGAGTPLVAASLEARKKLFEAGVAAAAGKVDYAAVRDEMIAAGKVFWVEHLPRVAVLESDAMPGRSPPVVKVKILEGEHKGKVGYITRPWVLAE
jgi:hypothetical protein